MSTYLPATGAWTDPILTRLNIAVGSTASDKATYDYLRGRWALAAGAVQRQVFGGKAPFAGLDRAAIEEVGGRLSSSTAVENTVKLMQQQSVDGLGDADALGSVLSDWLTTNVLDPIRGVAAEALWSGVQGTYATVETFRPDRRARIREQGLIAEAVMQARKLYILAFCEAVIAMDKAGMLSWFRKSSVEGLGNIAFYIAGAAAAGIVVTLALCWVLGFFGTDPNVAAVLEDNREKRMECQRMLREGGIPASMQAACAKAQEPTDPASVKGGVDWTTVVLVLGGGAVLIAAAPFVVGRIGAAGDVLADRRAAREMD